MCTLPSELPVMRIEPLEFDRSNRIGPETGYVRSNEPLDVAPASQPARNAAAKKMTSADFADVARNILPPLILQLALALDSIPPIPAVSAGSALHTRDTQQRPLMFP